MTTGNGGQAAAGGEAAASGWEAVRARSDIQFAPVELPEAAPPGWLARIFAALAEFFAPVARFLVAIWPVLQWILLALVVAAALYALYRLIDPSPGRPKKARHDAADETWAPAREDAVALLKEADRLAQEGRYGDATHLLLKRSVTQIAQARPQWIGASSTAREIARLPALPEPARAAFSTISDRVERSLFALRELGEEDWKAARDAYAQFAQVRFHGAAA